MLTTILTFIGCIVVMTTLAKLLWQVVKQLIPLNNSLQKYGKKQGNWAVVTGGTDGIGLGFCEVLADLCWNVCIIARNEQKILKTIENINKRIESKHGKNEIKIKYVVADFKNSSDKGFFDSIVKKLEGMKIGILVNNVGTSQIKQYNKYTMQQVLDIINVNVVSMAGLTLALLPLLNDKRTAMINLSSFLGENAAPYSSLYSATKAFNTFFSQSLSLQDNLKNVDIISVRPMFVQSPLSRQKKAFTVPDREQCARACLKQLRWEYQTHGYFIHRILAIVSMSFPKFIRRYFAKKGTTHHKQIYYKTQ